MGISIGLVGLGAFGSAFIPLFMKHPLVDRIALCDTEPERVARFARDLAIQDKFRPCDAYESLEEILSSDIDAVAIITQPWLHAAQAVQAMEAGKHVYSAVPIVSLPDPEEILEWCDRLVGTCRRTGMTYMLGETTYYRPQTMFCRRKAREGAFGHFVYAEGEYYHPFDGRTDLREVRRKRLDSRSGREWKRKEAEYLQRGIKNTPMTYPTHSTSGPISVMQAHAVKVSAFGHRPHTGDDYFDGSAFSNVTALFTMSNGAHMRICEYRELAYPSSRLFESEIFRVFGTEGSFRENHWADRTAWAPLTVEEMRDPLPPEVAAAYRTEGGESVVYGGHGGSHVFLVDEFVDAVAHGRRPAIHVWEAVRYMAAGMAAHKSALKEGEMLEVPDWGDPPV